MCFYTFVWVYAHVSVKVPCIKCGGQRRASRFLLYCFLLIPLRQYRSLNQGLPFFHEAYSHQASAINPPRSVTLKNMVFGCVQSSMLPGWRNPNSSPQGCVSRALNPFSHPKINFQGQLKISKIYVLRGV